MEVHRSNFWRELPGIIRAIAEADFVAIDLEMSGVQASERPRQPRPTSPQAIYEDAKSAAEMFQIVQLGLTCVFYDESTKCYHYKSFNFSVTPLFPPGSKDIRGSGVLKRLLDRKLCFSHNSLEFLQKSGFQLVDAFKDGIPYLSRQECTDLSEQFLVLDQAPTQLLPLDVMSHSEETQEFYRSAQHRILDLLKDDRPGAFCNFANPFDEDRNINYLQTQLLRQLIAKEFKGRVRIHSKDAFTQVIKHDKKAELRYLEGRLDDRRTVVRQQYGLLFVVEALAGRSFAKEIAAKLQLDEHGVAAMEKLETMLKAQRPILVGHNQFFDLCFLHQTFFGPLPPKLEAFESEVHSNFPRMADTKFMVEFGRHELAPDYNLRDLFTQVSFQTNPIIKIAAHTFGYAGNIDMSHDAGFDSWMTAVLFLKKSWSLARVWKEKAAAHTKNNQAQFQPKAPCFYPKARLNMSGSFGATATTTTASTTVATTVAFNGVTRSQSSGCLLDDDDDYISSNAGLMKPLSPERPKGSEPAARTEVIATNPEQSSVEKATPEPAEAKVAAPKQKETDVSCEAEVLDEWKIPD